MGKEEELEERCKEDIGNVYKATSYQGQRCLVLWYFYWMIMTMPVVPTTKFKNASPSASAFVTSEDAFGVRFSKNILIWSDFVLRFILHVRYIGPFLFEGFFQFQCYSVFLKYVFLFLCNHLNNSVNLCGRLW